MTVRKLESRDIQTVLELGRAMHKEGSFDGVAFSESKVLDLLKLCVLSPYYLCLVAEVEGELVGMYIAYITPYFFGDDQIAEERVLYVLPEHRGSSIAAKLIKRYLAWAEGHGVKEAAAGTSIEINTEGVKRLYESLGFDTVGYIFKKRI